MKFLKKQSNKATRRAGSPGTTNVFSYYASRSPSDNFTERNANKKLSKTPHQINWQMIPIALAGIVIFISFLYLLWLDVTPRIDVITLTPEKKLVLQSTEIYQKAGQELISKSIFNRFKLTVNTNQMAEDFKSQFPELSEVAIITPLAGHNLIFEIQPTTPTLALSLNKSDFIVLDERGRALFQTNDATRLNKLNLPIIVDESGVEVKVGDFVLPSENISFITEVIRQIQSKGILIESLILPPIANELHIRPANQKYYVKFNIVGDARLQAGSFIATIRHLEREGKVPGTYIDVRTQEKVYYQ